MYRAPTFSGCELQEFMNHVEDCTLYTYIRICTHAYDDNPIQEGSSTSTHQQCISYSSNRQNDESVYTLHCTNAQHSRTARVSRHQSYLVHNIRTYVSDDQLCMQERVQSAPMIRAFPMFQTKDCVMRIICVERVYCIHRPRCCQHNSQYTNKQK